MFMGPLTATKPWSTKGVEGVYRFLGRVWRLVMEENQAGEWIPNPAITDAAPDAALLKVLHQSIAKVTHDIDNLGFNTAISQMMILVNELTKLEKRPRTALETLILLLAPFAPHLAEECWQRLGHAESLSHTPWPKFDPQYLVEDTVEIVVQVQGKVRGKVTYPPKTNMEEVAKAAQELPDLKPWLDGKIIVKTITVPDKLVNFVVR
jgi:leucyl-tRNA synthetase